MIHPNSIRINIPRVVSITTFSCYANALHIVVQSAVLQSHFAAVRTIGNNTIPVTGRRDLRVRYKPDRVLCSALSGKLAFHTNLNAVHIIASR